MVVVVLMADVISLLFTAYLYGRSTGGGSLLKSRFHYDTYIELAGTKRR